MAVDHALGAAVVDFEAKFPVDLFGDCVGVAASLIEGCHSILQGVVQLQDHFPSTPIPGGDVPHAADVFVLGASGLFETAHGGCEGSPAFLALVGTLTLLLAVPLGTLRGAHLADAVLEGFSGLPGLLCFLCFLGLLRRAFLRWLSHPVQAPVGGRTA